MSKTIDNDLPLPDCAPTFGYESAKDKGAVIARAVYVDARTSGNWFVMSAMGRSAGHLAFGIGEACHYPMIVIPEMFNKTPITIDKIIRLMVRPSSSAGSSAWTTARRSSPKACSTN